MLFSTIFDKFSHAAPFCSMTQATLENIFSFDEIDRIFEDTAERQTTRELFFSTTVDLMCDVVFGVQPSIHAAYQGKKVQIPVSITSVYNKLNGVEPQVSSELVQQTAARMEPIIVALGGQREPLLEGYHVRILDGNHLAGTEHRIEELRGISSAALPGKSLLVYDPSLGLMTHVICCEDGHAQERSMLPAVLDLVEPKDLWFGDRNFCTTGFVFGIADRGASFLIRQHKTNLPGELVGKRRQRGRTETGTVYEQKMRIWQGEEFLMIRRITVELNEPTRDDETEIHLLTNIPVKAVWATRVAELYRKRWSIETAFAELTRDLCCEIKTLGYPRAALFGFSLAVVAYNIYSVSQAALRAVHGNRIDQEVSRYYQANEVRYAYGGMMIAVPQTDWEQFRQCTAEEMAEHLARIARNMDLSRYPKSKRGPKKKFPKQAHQKDQPHVSTFRVLQQTRALL